MPYNYEIIYRPGKDYANPADFISRHPDKATPFPDNFAENYVNYLCNKIIPKAMTLSEVQKETKNDSTLQKLLQEVDYITGLTPISRCTQTLRMNFPFAMV
jgi:hypothetical protein